MTRRLAVFVTVAVAGVAASADPPAVGPVWQVRLTLSADEYAAMQPRARGGFPGFEAAPKAPEKPADADRESHRNNFGLDLPWAKGTVAVGGETFANVGVRYKGNGTMIDAGRTIKKSFHVDLDRFGGSGRFQGSKTINLHCGVADPSKYREVLGYALYRAAGVPAPRTAFAEVRLTVPSKYDDELLGVYTVTEEIDKPFLRAAFGTDKGLLMKPQGVREIEDRGDDWDRCKGQYRPKRDATPAEAKRMIAFARLVHKADDATFQREIDSYLDIDGYLRFLAATAFVANVDSFFVLGQNYYLYLHPTTGRLHLLPWDLDRAFANHPLLGTFEQKMDLSITHPYGGSHRLTERILAMPGMGERYRDLFRELSATVFAKDRLLKDLDAAEAGMKELLARDVKAIEGRKEVNNPGNAMYGKPPDLRTFVERRTASVAAQLAGTSKGYAPTTGFGGFGAPQGPPPKVGDMMAGPLMPALDTDKDGKLSRDEWIATAKRVFAASAQDADGRVDQKALAAGLNSLFPKPPEGMPQPPPEFTLGYLMAGPILTKADANKDGKLTADELVAAAGATFDAADKAKAGKLDMAAFSEMLTALFPAPRFGPPPAQPKAEPKKP
ncbi:MAG: CotH kinase family protein [Gemmataceae bacterium]